MDKTSRIGIMSDFHLGHSGVGYWHNRLLYDRAEDIVRETVALLNRQSLDSVVILGDVTNDGSDAQLELARSILDKLTVPWIVIPGNHDREAVRTGRFIDVFGDHFPGLSRKVLGVESLFLPEYLPSDEYPRTELGLDFIESVIRVATRIESHNLFVFSHFPLIPQEDYAQVHNGKYAKHYLDGETLLSRLSTTVPGNIACFSGHQHWHRTVEHETSMHILTGSLIEYPMEARIVSLDGERLGVSILDSARPDIARESLDSSTWVAGVEGDRSRSVVLGRQGD